MVGPSRSAAVFITRYLKPEYIQLGLVNGHYDEVDPEKDRAKELERLKHGVVEELVQLFVKTGQVRNEHKFYLDLWNREKKASTAVGNGIAVPHVRSMQPRELAVVFARSREGVEYAAPDDKPVHIFFGITAPPYDDKVFLQFYKWIAQSFLEEEWLPQALLDAPDEHEILKILGGLR
jgi:mannitol/fructose-specific phosphotransferase system IIA component (Ntr-type)